MSRKRPERTERRVRERAARQAVRDRERLAAATVGGSPGRPIGVASSAIIEGRARSLACPQCAGMYRIAEHRIASGLRAVDVTCQQCGTARTLWFKIEEAN